MKKLFFLFLFLILVSGSFADNSIANDSSNISVPITGTCGNSICESEEGETCSSCSADCGSCSTSSSSSGSSSGTLYQCKDHIDNDGDGLIDFPYDKGCEYYNDDNETNPCTGEVTECPEWPECGDEKRVYRTCITDCGGTFEDFKDCPQEEVVAVEEITTEEEVIPTTEKELKWWELIPWTAVKEVGMWILIFIFLIVLGRLVFRYFKNKPKKPIEPPEDINSYMVGPLPPNPPVYQNDKVKYYPPKEENTPLDEFDLFIEKQNKKLDEVLTKSKTQYEKLNKVDKTVSRFSFNLKDTQKRLGKAKDNLKRKF